MSCWLLALLASSQVPYELLALVYARMSQDSSFPEKIWSRIQEKINRYIYNYCSFIKIVLSLLLLIERY